MYTPTFPFHQKPENKTKNLRLLASWPFTHRLLFFCCTFCCGFSGLGTVKQVSKSRFAGLGKYGTYSYFSEIGNSSQRLEVCTFILSLDNFEKEIVFECLRSYPFSTLDPLKEGKQPSPCSWPLKGKKQAPAHGRGGCVTSGLRFRLTKQFDFLMLSRYQGDHLLDFRFLWLGQG